jgi:hypothetical protein
MSAQAVFGWYGRADGDVDKSSFRLGASLLG